MKAVQKIIALLLIVAAFHGTASAERTIDKEEDAKVIYAQAKAFVARYKMSVPRDVIMRFETRDQIKADYSRSGRSGEHTRAYYQPHSPECICIPEGLEETEFFATAVHELTHAWQSSECPIQDRGVVEGAAYWMTSKAYAQKGRTDRAVRCLNRCSGTDPIECKVATKLELLYREKGIDEVIKYLKTTTRYAE